MKQFEKFRKWRQHGLINGFGIVVGADQTQEWILPWWWSHYSKANSYPVTFVDFGLTEKMKEWCKERGEYIRLPVPNVFVSEKEEVDPRLVQTWENLASHHFWECRNAWFKKPLACLQSPYEKTIWIDLDCEIRGSLAPCFNASLFPSQIAMVKLKLDTADWTIHYNTGVIVYERNLPLIESWADDAIEKNGLFRGDQELLTSLIAEKNLNPAELPFRFNWDRCYGDEPEALIFHWHGRHGKKMIRHQMAKVDAAV